MNNLTINTRKILNNLVPWESFFMSPSLLIMMDTCLAGVKNCVSGRRWELWFYCSVDLLFCIELDCHCWTFYWDCAGSNPSKEYGSQFTKTCILVSVQLNCSRFTINVTFYYKCEYIMKMSLLCQSKLLLTITWSWLDCKGLLG